jgi:hypothetical protein
LSKAGTAYYSLPELGNIFLDCEDWSRRYAELLEKAGDLLIERLSDIPQPFCLLLVARLYCMGVISPTKTTIYIPIPKRAANAPISGTKARVPQLFGY